MLIIINDDPIYVSWLSRHRQGFVVDAKHKLTRNHLVLHRAICSEIKPHKRARLTTGGHIKACSLDASELETWAREQTGGGLTDCPHCRPKEEESVSLDVPASGALTRLGREALSYVLDVTVMYLDGETTRYRATVQDVAEYLGKTAAQVSPTLQRLIDDGYLECPAGVDKVSSAATAIAYPTTKALQTIPAFAAMSQQGVAAELDRLNASH